ncbi:unnamed protein product [Ectocarpus sp. 12 AP-2014]
MLGIQARLFGDGPTWIRSCADIPTEATVAGTRPSPSYRPHRLCSNPQVSLGTEDATTHPSGAW